MILIHFQKILTHREVKMIRFLKVAREGVLISVHRLLVYKRVVDTSLLVYAQNAQAF